MLLVLGPLGCPRLPSATDGGVDPTPSAPPTAAELYDPSVILRVDLELPEAAWDEIRHQTPHALSVLGDTCLRAPPTSPYTEVPADVELNGTRLENAALRKKGFVGSASTTKPSLKIQLDEYVAGQQLGGVDRLTLNNNRADPSQLRQCLGYRVIADAGLPAPHCALAWVTVNGEPLGIYTHLEPIKRRFLRRHFSDDGGLLYEATFSDFRAGWVETFEAKTSATDDRNALRAIALALERPDEELVDALAATIDVEQFFRFWALEVLVGHGDGYTRSANNFFIYRDPAADRFVFFPWGTDVILQPDRAFAFEPRLRPVSHGRGRRCPSGCAACPRRAPRTSPSWSSSSTRTGRRRRSSPRSIAGRRSSSLCSQTPRRANGR